ncbi:hypothetical protein PQX77_019993 [Marasmius sp. AFHP31]|nr:hypothetical protein PQX77_019993 [Marasmius sp. AFHP31]
MAPGRFSFFKNWYATEAIPIYVVVGGTVTGAFWYLYRLSMGPTIQWTKDNPQPWNSIKPNQSTKILSVTHEHDGKWSRDKL